ncbi:hypothetical protein OMAG_002066 [Candidatus Omnitrophus magneticus]|uniref:HEPN domain-containing protein n=1 Tax=Candidatus Omnitrophus magneticus TaxID=1609969 RepID=A0A0F0CLD4_9BACT|nr:hypothetical protein OMAG_002066 [Candidatus Omnitrophus magneticus]
MFDRGDSNDWKDLLEEGKSYFSLVKQELAYKGKDVQEELKDQICQHSQSGVGYLLKAFLAFKNAEAGREQENFVHVLSLKYLKERAVKIDKAFKDIEAVELDYILSDERFYKSGRLDLRLPTLEDAKISSKILFKTCRLVCKKIEGKFDLSKKEMKE